MVFLKELINAMWSSEHKNVIRKDIHTFPFILLNPELN